MAGDNVDLQQNGRKAYVWMNDLLDEIKLCDERVESYESSIRRLKERKAEALRLVPDAISRHNRYLSRLVAELAAMEKEQ